QVSRPAESLDTSTRLSKNVAPPPRSVNAVAVVALQFAPPTAFDHQTPNVTTTPGLTVSPTTARARNRPRSLKTVTTWPSSICRSAASAGCICTVGSPADRRRTSTLTNVELRKAGSGGQTICKGYFSARAGFVCGSSYGGT